jgi:hypothetical protein
MSSQCTTCPFSFFRWIMGGTFTEYNEMHISIAIIMSILTSLYSVFIFALGISEATLLNHYKNYDSECNNIWKLLLYACVFDISNGIFSIIMSVVKIGCLECCLSKFFQFLCLCFNVSNIVIGIWSIYIHHNLDDTCYNFWNSNANDLFNFVLVHYVLLCYIGLVIVIIFIISFAHIMSKKCCCKIKCEIVCTMNEKNEGP